MVSRKSVSILAAGVVVATSALTVTPTVSASAANTRFTAGAPGVGDPYFPLEGNGGYNVSHYTLKLSYDPANRHLAGVNHITARATQNLSRFDLDLKGLHVRKVKVNGIRAKFHRDGQELVVTPRFGVRRGASFSADVTYAGSPKTIVGSPIVFGAPYGWIYTKDGAFVGCEPNAASTWYPSNDHPSDKASFTFRITVPKGRSVVANGQLSSRRAHHGRTTFVWDERQPMATYLATIDIGKWEFLRGRTRAGIPETVAIDPALARQGQRVFRRSGLITDYWQRRFGRYPFRSTGAIVDDVPDIGFSLETQTRPLYGFAPDDGTMSHELAHQWFGDSVSVANWQHIWLNEGFATFASWLWTQHTGGPSTWAIFRQVYDEIPASSSFWDQAIANPQRDTMFAGAVYTRGGLTLAALRHKIGDRDFFRLLHTWTRIHRHGNATTHQFVVLAERITGQDLRPFFHTWLWQKSKPASW